MMLKRFIPKMYQEDIYNIDYNKLKKMGIKCILIDLDNTISPAKEVKYYDKTKELFEKLKKDFTIVVFSNNFPSRVKGFGDYYGVDHCFLALKPCTYKYRSIKKKYNLKSNQIATIGDQLLTDIQGGNKMKFLTILVKPMCDIDEKETWLNRKIEEMIFEKFEKNGILTRGKYYD